MGRQHRQRPNPGRTAKSLQSHNTHAGRHRSHQICCHKVLGGKTMRGQIQHCLQALAARYFALRGADNTVCFDMPRL
eukprot:7651680-Alexandrium_andersonii.AAC.1